MVSSVILNVEGGVHVNHRLIFHVNKVTLYSDSVPQYFFYFPGSGGEDFHIIYHNSFMINILLLNFQEIES